ncbi:MAG: hypothetical protein AAGC67_21520, partial [Myxococcota bacterium]
ALRQQGQLTLLLEPVKADPAAPTRVVPAQSPSANRDPARPAPVNGGLVDPPSPSAFRTGLTDADLRTEPLLPA